MDWFRAELERRLGFALEAPRSFTFATNGDEYGWVQGSDGAWHYTLFIENGRVADVGATRLMSGLQEIARIHRGEFRVTPNQNLIVANVAAKDKRRIATLLKSHGLDRANQGSTLRLNSMSCVGLSTCGLAMAESERYLPDLIGKVETILAARMPTTEALRLGSLGMPAGWAPILPKPAP